MVLNPETYMEGIDGKRVQQIHLAGHDHCGNYIVDTHDAAIVEPVWQLYEKAIKRFVWFRQ